MVIFSLVPRPLFSERGLDTRLGNLVAESSKFKVYITSVINSSSPAEYGAGDGCSCGVCVPPVFGRDVSSSEREAYHR